MLWDTIVDEELEEMQRDMEALAEWSDARGSYRFSFPLINAYESKDDYILAAIVPGLAKDRIDIRFDEGALILKGRRPHPVEEGPDRAYVRRERAYGDFEKTIRLPLPVERSRISAKLENGVLTLTLAHVQPVDKATRLTIQ